MALDDLHTSFGFSLGLLSAALILLVSSPAAQAQVNTLRDSATQNERQRPQTPENPSSSDNDSFEEPSILLGTRRQDENETTGFGGAANDERDDLDPSLTREEREAFRKRQEIDSSLTAEERAYQRSKASQLRPSSIEDDTTPTPPGEPEIIQNEISQEPQRERPLPQPAFQEDFSPYPEGQGWATSHPADDDPYAPVGINLGSFIFYPEATIEGLASDNVFLSGSNQKSDVAIEFRPSLIVESNWSRHALKFDMRGTFSSYKEFSSENVRDYAAGLRGRLDLTRRTNIEGEADYDVSQEGRGSLDFNQGASEKTDITSHGYGVGINHRFNRMTIGIKGTIGEVDYADVPLTTGGIENNDDRDYRQYEGVLRIAYDFKPGFAVFTQGELGERNYRTKFDDDGFQRSSSRHAFRGGLLIDIGPKLRGEVSVGYAWQAADDSRFADIGGFILDANLQWRPSELTTLTFLARSDIEETTFGNSAGVFERYYGVEMRHALRRHIILTGGAGYLTEEYDGINTKQNTLDLSAGAEYLLSRSAAIVGNYQFSTIDGENVEAYQVNEVRLGLRLRR